MTSTQLIQSNTWWDNFNNADINLLKEKKSLITEELFKIAGKELRENDTNRKQSLQHLREWINKNADIVNCLTDDNFLLRFLRVKKFSIPMAEQTLLKYLNFRKRFKHIMYDLDYTESKVNELIDNGYIYVSPYRDSNGRRVILYNISKFDLNKYSNIDMAKAHAITYETLINDEENQILGVNHIANLAGVSTAFLTLFSISEFATLIRWGEQSFPMRHKEINFLNLPAAVKFIYDFAKSNMSPKLRERIAIHNTFEELKKRVDKKCLPEEYGGQLSARKMIEMWKNELANKRDRLLSFDQMTLISDQGIIRRRTNTGQDNTGEGSLPGSFRKLELD